MVKDLSFACYFASITHWVVRLDRSEKLSNFDVNLRKACDRIPYSRRVAEEEGSTGMPREFRIE